VEGALPTVLLADRYRATHRKYVMPPPTEAGGALTAAPGSGSAPGGGGGGGGGGIAAAVPEQVAFLLSAVVPQPAALTAWAGNVAAGRVTPTLLGERPPPGNAHPTFPWLSVATSATFSEVVLDPRHDVALEAYLGECPMCMALGARVRMAGYLASRYFPSVRVAVMNVDDNERPREWMPGPAFPTVQLFNGGGGRAPPLGYSKMHGPGCSHLAHGEGATGAAAAADAAGVAARIARAAAPAAGAGRAPRVVGNAPAGTPPCVPALDFAHPTNAGRMALPSVRELVEWLGRNATLPFDPAAVAVPRSELRDAALRYPEYAEAVGVVPVPASGAGAQSPPLTLTLAALCEDMEVEARVLETGVFRALWMTSVGEQYAKAFLPPGGGGGGGGHAARQAREAKLAAFRGLLAQAREAVVDKGMYGSAEAAEAALDAADASLRETGLLAELRAHLRDVDGAAAEVEAAHAARALVGGR
jgi:hypothetical protein